MRHERHWPGDEVRVLLSLNELYGKQLGLDLDLLPLSLLSRLDQEGTEGAPAVREVKRLACEAAARKELNWAWFTQTLSEHASSKPPTYTRRTWRALTMHKCGGFHSHVSQFTLQAAVVAPSQPEKIDAFLDGLSLKLKDRVLLTATGEEWTSFETLIQVATRFAISELQTDRSGDGAAT